MPRRNAMIKKTVVLISLLLVSAAIPAMAQQTNEEKVICQLAAKNCLNKVDVIKKKINKLNAEIKKGTKTYSAEELKKLEQKLKETEEVLDKLEGK
jgi:uncharacterized protein YlxW (UPF0749 family)